MEIRDFAAQLLHGETLSDKLCAPDCLSDDAPGSSVRVPLSPGRPPGLGLKDWGLRERAPFPTNEGMADPFARGIAMHYFANHELLAIELMALVLLRFPGAPRAFRRSIAATILEEQAHLRLYLGRMQALGVSFGEVPVNDFFWRCLACVTDPLAFVAGMGLTFEQANLDFSLGFQESFARVGDAESATIMRRVYEDEVGHVRHGVAWLRAWKDPAMSDWDAYVHALPAPLNPSRAKGTRFYAIARSDAGLAPEFSARLEAYARSKGRAPDVLYFNPGCDSPSPPGGKRPWLKALERDFAPLFGLVAVPGDIVLTPDPPSTLFTATLANAGLPLPEFRDSPPSRPLGRFVPWGWDEDAQQTCARIFPGMSADGDSRRVTTRFPPVGKSFGARALSSFLASIDHARWIPLCAPGDAGSSCATEAECRTAIQACLPADAIIKAEHCAAGQERQILRGPPNDNQLAWIKRTLSRQGSVQVEPWLRREIDLSVQIRVTPEGEPRIIGHTQFLTSARGQYVGTLFSRRVEGLGVADRRALQSRAGEDLSSTLEAAAKHAGRLLGETGYAGPAGIDAFLYRDDADRLRLKPICEVNARHTMGLMSLTLKRRIASGRVGAWLHLNRADAEQAGGFEKLAKLLRERFPLKTGSWKSGMLWESGHLWTTEPERASLIATVVLIEENLDTLVRVLDELGLKRARDRLPHAPLQREPHSARRDEERG